MVTPHNPIFRKEALDRVASPEQLDWLVQVASPRRWLSLAGLGLLVSAATAWSVFAKVPTTVTGKGILVYPSKVVSAQSTVTGQLLEVKIKTGDHVKPGDVLATLDQSDLKQQLQLSREKLTQLQTQDRDFTFIQAQRDKFDQDSVEKQRQALQQGLDTLQSMTPLLRDRGLASMESERTALQQRLATLKTSQPTYKQRWEARQILVGQGAAPKDMALQAQQEYEAFQTQIDQVELQLKQLDTKAAEAEKQDLQNANQITEIKAKLAALTVHKETQDGQDFSTMTNRQKEIQETQRTIAQLESQLKKSVQIVSTYDGVLLDVTAKPGQRIEAGAGLGNVSLVTDADRLLSVVFIPLNDGKKIAPGMAVQVTPTNVKREEFGGIAGKVMEVSPLSVTQQAMTSLVGNPEMLKGLMGEGGQIAVYTDLTPDATDSGYQWSSSKGPTQKITQGTPTTVRITIEERAPITYVLPFLKTLMGGN
jgi:HlyD family secretion protein